MSTPNFCFNCGSPVNPGAKFCSKCGQPVHADPAPAPTSAQTGEQVVGVLPGATRRAGVLGLKMESFVIVLTDRRVILAAQTAEMVKNNVRRAREQASQDGKGFFGKVGAQLSANSGGYYFNMSPDQILAEQPGNYFYAAGQIQSIHLREHSDDDSMTTIYDFEIQCGGKKEKFQFNRLDLNAVRNLALRYYGNIVR